MPKIFHAVSSFLVQIAEEMDYSGVGKGIKTT